MPAADCAVTIISVDEQLHGRLAVIRRAKTQLDAAREYERLREMFQFYRSIQILPYDTAAVAIFELLRNQRIRIGTQDLRIAAIALSLDSVVVTRNLRDFGRVPGLKTEDWSIPITSGEE